MNSRERFCRTVRYEIADRVPLFEEGIRTEVIEAWRGQGLAPDADLSGIFSFDRYERIEPELKPRPRSAPRPSSMQELEAYRRLLNPADPDRLGEDWPHCVARWQSRDYPLMLSVTDGLFLSLGVEDWRTFSEAVARLACEPRWSLATMRIHGEFSAGLAETILKEVEIDAAIFVEPVCDNHGPLVSPQMYEEYALKAYQPILEVLQRRGVGTIIFMTWANARLLLQRVVKYGFNCLWAYERNAKAMDYLDVRREFGRDLRLIGGIDLDRIREGGEALRREILEKAPPLLADGGYIPLADGRVREDMPYGNYVRYRRLLEEVAHAG